MNQTELQAYLDKLTGVINDALRRYETQNRQSASLRRLATLTGKPQRFNTLYKWTARGIKSPVRSSSLVFLSDVDGLCRPAGQAGRSPLELDAHLRGMTVSEYAPNESTAADIINALREENINLKKQRQQILEAATA